MSLSRVTGVAGILLGVLAIAAPVAKAAPLPNTVREGQGVTTELAPNASAITYWIREPDGWHVVTTVDTVIGENADDGTHAVVRFSAVLLPGQSQVISVPFARGLRQPALRIRRLGDQIEVERVSGPTS